ncbi:MAG: hypothetical protein V4619_01565 [Bacteroidota bacterium]
MFKNSRLVILLLLTFCCFRVAAFSGVDSDFLKILQQTDKDTQKRQLVKYIRGYFRSKPVEGLLSRKAEIGDQFVEYKLDDRAVFNYFIDYLYKVRIGRLGSAETSLVKAIQLVLKNKDEYLLYVFYTELGFLQSDNGNATEAVYSYSIAGKKALVLENATYQVTVDINLSDIFHRNGLYKQSLSHLRHAQNLVANQSVTDQLLINTIYSNIADNYFKLKNIDSVKKYNNLLRTTPNTAYNKYIFIKLTDYHLSLLQGNYKGAVNQILALRTDSLYQYSHHDDEVLVDAYYQAGMHDSAKVLISQLLSGQSLKNHPEVKYHLYDVLGQIAEQSHDEKSAAYYFKTALQQAEQQISRLTQVDNISSQLKIDEVENAFSQKEENYKKERLGLIYVLVITILTIAVITMIFSANRKKRYYEKLVFDAKKRELSFINSHEVRRHLSNLLGLIDVIRNSEDKHKQYQEAEPMILQEAEALDGAIKTISEKLETDIEIKKPAKDGHSGLV